jgi:hypothetical protein
MGWSNGAFFSQEYALFRTRRPTPNGHRVAAVVAFGEKNDERMETRPPVNLVCTGARPRALRGLLS